MGIVTDSTPADAPKDHETCNVMALYRLFASKEKVDEHVKMYREPMYGAGKRAGRPYGYGDIKGALFTQIKEHFAAARISRDKLAADPAAVEAVLRAGAKRARTEARRTMALVREAVGMTREPLDPRD